MTALEHLQLESQQALDKNFVRCFFFFLLQKLKDNRIILAIAFGIWFLGWVCLSVLFFLFGVFYINCSYTICKTRQFSLHGSLKGLMGRLQAWLGISAFEEQAAHACLESLMLLKDCAFQVRRQHGSQSAASETLCSLF